MLDWPDAAKQGSLYAAGVGVAVLGVLFFTRRWWSLRSVGILPTRAARSSVPHGAPNRRADGDAAKVFWPALAAIVVLAGVLRLPLASSSLWWDEVWQARNASVGEWRPDKKVPGTLKFRETTFAQALWNYRKPANHPPMAVASKACHEVWKASTGARPGEFSEFVLRLPGFIASLAGITLIACLLRAWGHPFAGIWAAAFLAIHPWHIRYGIDNRGYTFLIPLTIVGLWSLWRACGPPARSVAFKATHPADDSDITSPRGQDGHAPGGTWWIFGVTQALLLWSHLFSVWVCLALCATGGWWIWRQHTGEARWRRLARLAAVQSAGAVLFLLLFLPNLLQALQWGEKNQDGQLLNGPVLADSLAQVAVGQGPMAAAPIVLALVLAGLGIWWKRQWSGLAGVVALIAGASLFLVALWAADFYFYPRFLFAVMVPLAAAVGVALASVVPGRRNGRRPAYATGLLAAGCVLGLRGVAGVGSIDLTGERGFSPLREAAYVMRAAQKDGAHVFGYGFGAEALQYYLPTLPYAREADAPEALAAAVEDARAAGRPLVVAVGYEDLNRLALPEGFNLLDDPSRFTEIWKQSGLEPQFAYRIRRVDPPITPAEAEGR